MNCHCATSCDKLAECGWNTLDRVILIVIMDKTYSFELYGFLSYLYFVSKFLITVKVKRATPYPYGVVLGRPLQEDVLQMCTIFLKKILQLALA